MKEKEDIGGKIKMEIKKNSGEKKEIKDIWYNKQIIAIICNQFGDSGKGKYVDVFAEEADVIDRGTGGPNAGHTVMFDGKKYVLHTVPSGITYAEKLNIMGNGMVVDPVELIHEMDVLLAAGLSLDNLLLSQDARVILDFHIEEDILKNKSDKNGGIGSTGRGIGLCYEDKANRTRSIKIMDLFNDDVLFKKLQSDEMLAKYKNTMADFKEHRGEFGNTAHLRTNMSEIMDKVKMYRERLRPFVADTIRIVNEKRLEGKKILLEGAQGLFLSYEYGLGKYVTSSDCSINGTAAGAGLSAQFVDLTLGLVKFPYMTRVGGGPFPTEFTSENAADYNKRITSVTAELSEHNIPFVPREGNVPKYDHQHSNIISLMDSADPLLQGAGIRLAGEEYGATTGRLRRPGWTDLELLKRAVLINGPDVILTKADVLRGAEEFKLGVGYKNMEFSSDPAAMSCAVPKYVSFKGFDEDISKIDNFNDLPKTLLSAIDLLERYTGAHVRIVSTGPDRESSIIVK